MLTMEIPLKASSMPPIDTGMNLVSSLPTTHSTKKHIMIQVVMTTYPPWSSSVMAPWRGIEHIWKGEAPQTIAPRTL
jgi:hypothetical protein